MPEIVGDQPWRDNLFFAIRPDPATAVSINRLAYHLRSKFRLRGRPLAPGRLHISLHGLGEYVGLPPGLVREAIEVAALIEQEPFEVEFDQIFTFHEAHALVLCATDEIIGLRLLHRSLGVALAKVGIGKATVDFTPHVTLLYDKQVEDVDESIEPMRWAVRDFTLVHSYAGITRHETLGRWQLSG